MRVTKNVMNTMFSLTVYVQSALAPEQLVWCGMDSVLLYWDDMLLMVGPYGDPVRYLFDDPIILIPECDGARILSNLNMEFLQRVPSSTESIFKIGSTEPAALLYDALDHFDRRSAKVGNLCNNRTCYVINDYYNCQILGRKSNVNLFQADENLRLIRSSLPEAVEACVDAAGHEFDPLLQQTLLRAASYGQAFCRLVLMLIYWDYINNMIWKSKQKWYRKQQMISVENLTEECYLL